MKGSNYFFDPNSKWNLAIFWELLSWQAPRLIGKVSKAFEPSNYRPTEDQEEYRGKDREEHRGASRGAGGNGFLTILIAGCR